MKTKLLFPFLLLTLLAFCGCTVTTFEPTKVHYYADFERNAQSMDATMSPANLHFYPLQFDRNGKLMNYTTLIRATREIDASWHTNLFSCGGHSCAVSKPINKIIVASFGWNHTHAEAEKSYKDWFDRYFEANGLTGDRLTNGWAVFCVSWDSTPTGLKTFLNDYLVSPKVSDFLAAAPDKISVPVTFWAKSALADRIGYHDLKFAVEYIYENGYDDETRPHADIYLLGHSFGCRVLSGVANTRKLFNSDNGGKEFKFQTDNAIKAGVFIQPALAALNLPSTEKMKYPLIITQSRHDHLNSLLFPIGSIVINPAVSTAFETAKFGSHPLFTPGTNHFLTVGAPNLLTNTIAKNTTLEEKEITRGRTFRRETGQYLNELGTEFWRLPYSLAISPFCLTSGYIKSQRDELKGKNWRRYVPNTLAQLPGVEVPVQLLGLNDHHKGALNFGSLNESVARTTFDKVNMLTLTPPTEPGIHFENGEKEIRHGIFEDYQKEMWDFTVGWVDPLGAHNDYEPDSHSEKKKNKAEKSKDEESNKIFKLVHAVLNKVN